MKDFFIDTADVNYIRELWSKIKDKVDPKLVRGITTNPNAFFKLGKHRLIEWMETLPELCTVLAEIRGDANGVVYVQGPNSNMTNSEIDFYIKMISSRNVGSKIGLKIPPYEDVLTKLAKGLYTGLEINVTGVSDAGTALRCFTYPGVRYVSIIPGRMEEVGIDAKAHLDYVASRNKIDLAAVYGRQEVIAGSMRTIDGLIMTFQHDTVPTIGERVWNEILKDDNLDKLLNIDYSQVYCRKDQEFCPQIDAVNTKLSTDFFEQMDNCGKVAYEDLQAGHQYLKNYFDAPKFTNMI